MSANAHAWRMDAEPLPKRLALFTGLPTAVEFSELLIGRIFISFLSLSTCNRTGQDADRAMDVRVGGRQDRFDLKRGLNWYTPRLLLSLIHSSNSELGTSPQQGANIAIDAQMSGEVRARIRKSTCRKYPQSFSTRSVSRTYDRQTFAGHQHAAL